MKARSEALKMAAQNTWFSDNVLILTFLWVPDNCSGATPCPQKEPFSLGCTNQYRSLDMDRL